MRPRLPAAGARQFRASDWSGARAHGSQPCSRAASGLRPEVLWPPARSWLTAARKAPQKARPDAVRRTPQQSAERRAGGRIPPVISGDPEMDLTARQVTGCGVPHQRLSALCSPHFFRGAENRRRAPGALPNRTMTLGCLTLNQDWTRTQLEAALRADRTLVPRPPPARIDLRQEIPEHLVEQRRLLDVHGVAALREDREAGRGDVLLEIDARLDAGVVFVAADDQRGDRDLLDLGLELGDRWTVGLIAAQRVGGALRGVARELVVELLVAARVLHLEGIARRPHAIGLGHAVGAHLVVLGGGGAGG